MGEPTKLRDLIRVAPADVEKALGRGGTPGIDGFAASLAAEKMNSALDIDLYTVLAKGWTSWSEVKATAQKSRAKPLESFVQNLGKHEVKQECYPTLQLYVGEAPLPEVVFKLEFVARLKSLRLSISNGRLDAVAPGEASATVTLRYGDIELAKRETPSWVLPGTIPFKPGLEITAP